MLGTTPSGWYPDPQGSAPLRWWDGLWWTAWESDGSRQWFGALPEPARRLRRDDLPALGLFRTVFLVEAQRRGLLPSRQAQVLAGLADDLAAEVLGRPAPAQPTPPGTLPTGAPPARDAAPAAPWPSTGTTSAAATPVSVPTGVAPTGAAPPVPVPPAVAPPPSLPPVSMPPVSVPSAPWPPASLPAGAAPRPTAPRVPTTSAPVPRPPGRLARWWAESRLRLDTDLTVHGLTYLGVLLLFVGVFGLVAFAFGDVSPALRPVAELAVAGVPFVAASLLARSGARFVARAMVAVGALILPVMLVTSTVDGFGFPPDLHGVALPLGTGLGCAVVAAVYVARTARRPDSPLGAMWAPAVWFAAGMAAVALGRPVPRGEDVAVPGSAQVAVIALALLGTTLIAARWRSRADDDDEPAVDDEPTSDRAPAPDGEPAPDRDRARGSLAEGALAGVPAGLVVTAVLALVAWFAEGWPILPAVGTAAALALAAALRWPARAEGFVVGGWVVVLLRVATVDDATPLLSEPMPFDGVGLDARPALVLAALLAGVGLLEWLARRAPDKPVPVAPEPVVIAPVFGPAPVPTVPLPDGFLFGLVGWVVAFATLMGPFMRPGAWWGIGGAAAIAVWAAVRRAHPPRLAGASMPLDALAAVAPLAVIGGVWREGSGAVAGLLAAALALAVTPLARGRLGRGAVDRFWLAWWGGLLVTVLFGTVALAADGLLDGAAAERAVVPAMLVLVLAALVVGPTRAPTTVGLVTPVLWGLWGAVVAATEIGDVTLAVGYAVLGLGAVLAVPLARRAPDGEEAPALVAVAAAGHLTGVVGVLMALVPERPQWPFAAALGAATLGWLVTAVAGDRGRSPLGAVLDRARLGSLPWLLALLGLPATALVVLDASDVVRPGAPWWSTPLLVAALACAVGTRARTPDRLRPLLPWTGFGLAVAAVGLAAAPNPDRWSAVVELAVVVLVAVLVRDRHPVMVWTAWTVLAPLAAAATWNASADARDLGVHAVSAGALVGVGGLLVVGALLADRARPREPRLLPLRVGAQRPFLLGAGQLVVGGVVAAALPDPAAAGVLLLVVAGFGGVVAALSGVGVVGAVAVLVAWAGVRIGWEYPGAWADLGLAALLLAVALAVSFVRPPAVRWARWDAPLAVAAGLPAVVALGVATVAEQPPVYVLVGALVIGAAVRLWRWRPTRETLATVGRLLVLLGSAWAGRAWAVVALLVLAAGDTALAAFERGVWRTVRQWVGALLAAVAWLVVLGGPWLGDGAQTAVDVTAVGGALVAVGVLVPVAAGWLHRSWALPWASLASAFAVMACLAPVVDPTEVSDAAATLAEPAGSVLGWWQVAAWALLAVVAELAGHTGVAQAGGVQAGGARAGWRLVAVVPVLAALLAGFEVAGASLLLRVLVLAVVSFVAAVVVLVGRRTGRRAAWAGETPVGVLGVATLVLAAGFALAADATVDVVPGPGGSGLPRVLLVAAVLAVAAVEAATYGVALRILALRAAAPVLAWVAWALYAADAFGGVVAWYTVPVGLAMIAVVEVWRADRRERGLPPSDPAVAALDVAGIGFLVVASFVAAFTVSVLHALVAAGVGVLVFGWSLLTRVRRRLLAGATVVLAGVVVAAVLPLVALVPAWGGAGMWVLVAVVGLLVVLAATFLERGRAAVRGGRTRLMDATAGWE